MRKSGIELLRIICFLMVCSIHITTVGLVIAPQFTEYSLPWFYATLARTFSCSAVPIFVLISGYVNVHSTKSTKNQIKSILLPLLTYIPFLIGLSLYQNMSIQKILLDFLQLIGNFYHLWYIAIYLIIRIIFNNIKNFNEDIIKNNGLKIFIGIMLLTLNSTIYDLFKINTFLQYMSNTLMYLSLMYLLGYYINIKDIHLPKKNIFISFNNNANI